MHHNEARSCWQSTQLPFWLLLDLSVYNSTLQAFPATTTQRHAAAHISTASASTAYSWKQIHSMQLAAAQHRQALA
jgi:hypothetical protein